MSKKLLLSILVILLQIGIVFGLLLSGQIIFWKGVEVHLRLEPVDPRNPFRGDYVRLNYQISNFDGVSEIRPTYNSIAYLNLISKDFSNPEETQIGQLSKEFEKSENPDTLQIRGKIDSYSIDSHCREPVPGNLKEPFSVPSQIKDCQDTFRVNMDYGIEEYFIQEESGWDLPDFEKAVAVVFVSPDNGRAVLKEVRIDGQKWP